MGDTKALQLRDEQEEGFTGAADELPSQGGSATPTVMPGISLFQLPPNLDQLWSTFDVEKKTDDGQVITHPAGTIIDAVDVSGKAVLEQHLMLKFDRENPLIVVGGPFDGLPAMCTISTLNRKRGKKDDLHAKKVSDMTYFVRKALRDNTLVTFKKDWMPIVNKYVGHQIRLEHGLSAFCDPERTRYVEDGAGGTVEDPNGNKGCGKGPAGKDNARYYSMNFRIPEVNAETGEATGRQVFTDRIICVNCGASLRGFFRIEKFLEPLGTTQVVQA